MLSVIMSTTYAAPESVSVPLRFADNCTVDACNVHEKAKHLALMPLTPLILLSNGFVLALLGYLRYFRRPSFLLIASLCCADILVGGACIATLVTESRERTMSRCLARVGVSVAAVQASILSLLAVACDRLLAIVHALTYLRLVTPRRTVIVISMVWLFSMLLGLLPVLGWNDGEESYHGYCSFLHVLPPAFVATTFACGLLPIAAILLIHAYLYAHARVHIRRIDALEQVLGRKELRALGMTGRSWRCVRTVSMVAGCVLACWCPFLLAALYVLLVPRAPCVLADVVGTHLLLLGFCNSALNPVLYAARNRELRTSFVTAVRRHCYKRMQGPM